MDELDLAAVGYLVDLDGTLVSGGRLLPDAAWLFRSVGERIAIVSNDAEHTPRQLAVQLRRLGLEIAADRIILAGIAAIELVAAERPGAQVLLLASPTLCAYGRRLGLQLSGDPLDRVDVVLVGRDRGFTYAKLAAACLALRQGAELIVANPDGRHPGPNGEPVPETGALAAAIIACAGERPYRIVGKPGPALFELACRRLSVSPADAVMIGDNRETDGSGAERLGMRFVHVRNGRIRHR